MLNEFLVETREEVRKTFKKIKKKGKVTRKIKHAYKVLVVYTLL